MNTRQRPIVDVLCGLAVAATAILVRPALAQSVTAERLPALAPDAPIRIPAIAGPNAYSEELFPNAIPADGLPTLSDEALAVPGAEPVIQDGTIVPLSQHPFAADDLTPPNLGDAIGYDTATGGATWIVAHDNRFGLVSFESLATLPKGITHGLVTGMSFHFLDGPVQTDMPPRLFDFSIGYQLRRWIWPNVGFDIVARVGVFSDFEGSARDGVRFPGHGVAFFRMTPGLHLFLGVDELDRDDISLLPVFGAVWMPNHDLRIDAAFPRPSVAVRLGRSDDWMYLSGQLGGGTWAIERVDLTDDNATYRDLRFALGFERRRKDSSTSSFEVAYVFARDLSYRSGMGDLDLEDAVMLGLNNRY